MYTAFSAGAMTLRPNSQGLYRARSRVRGVLRELDLSEDDRDRLLIAVGEAISNAYLHGTHDPRFDSIRVAWTWANGRIMMTVKDNGSGFSKEMRIYPSERGLLARGIELMRAGVDEVGFSHDDGATVVLTKRLSPSVSE